MDTQNRAVFFVAIAGISFGFLPALSIISESLTLDLKTVALIGFVVSTLFFGVAVAKRGYNVTKTFLHCIVLPNLRNFLIARVVSGLNPFLFFWALGEINQKLYGVLIYESYPIIAVAIASFLFQNRKASPLQWILIAISLFGLFLLPASKNPTEIDPGMFIKTSLNITEYIFFGVILLASILSAVAAVSESEISKIYSEIEKSSPVDSALITKFSTNVLTTLLVFLFYITSEPLSGSVQIDLKFDTILKTLAMGVMYAVLIDITPGFFSRMAGPYITNNSVFSLWMLAPIVGAISVVLLTDEKISQILALSGFLIIGGNALLTSTNQIPRFLYLSLIFLLLITPLAALIPSQDFVFYFEIVSVMTVFVSLLTGFTLVRLSEIDRDLINYSSSEIKKFNYLRSRRKRYTGELIVITFMSSWLIVAVIALAGSGFWMSVFQVVICMGVFASCCIGWIHYIDGKDKIDFDSALVLADQTDPTNYSVYSVFLLPVFVLFSVFCLVL